MHEGALVEAFEEFGYVLIDLDATGVEEFLSRPASGISRACNSSGSTLLTRYARWTVTSVQALQVTIFPLAALFDSGIACTYTFIVV